VGPTLAKSDSPGRPASPRATAAGGPLNAFSLLATAEALEADDEGGPEDPRTDRLPSTDGRGAAGAPEEVVAVREEVWFDIRPALQATDWTFALVILAEQARGSSDLAAKLNPAHAGGPAAAEAVLDLEGRAPLEGGTRLFDRQPKLFLKADDALDRALVTSRDSFQFVKLYAELRLAERRLELEAEWSTEPTAGQEAKIFTLDTHGRPAGYEESSEQRPTWPGTLGHRGWATSTPRRRA
jgi:hypothetical protein